MAVIAVPVLGVEKCNIEEMGEEWPNVYIVDLPNIREWIWLGGFCLVNPKCVNEFKEENRV